MHFEVKDVKMGPFLDELVKLTIESVLHHLESPDNFSSGNLNLILF